MKRAWRGLSRPQMQASRLRRQEGRKQENMVVSSEEDEERGAA